MIPCCLATFARVPEEVLDFDVRERRRRGGVSRDCRFPVFFAGLIVEQAEQPIAILDGVSDSTDPRSG